jgi:hypothetical protein
MSNLQVIELKIYIAAWANLVLAVLSTAPWAIGLHLVLSVSLFCADARGWKTTRKE